MMSDTLRNVLTSCGWHEDRIVDPSKWVTRLAAEGFIMIPEAVSILKSFGGLTIVPQKSPDAVFLPDKLTFDPVLAASGEFEAVDYWQSTIGKKLSPIAEIGGGAILMVGDDGQIMSCWPDRIWRDGASFIDALENTLIIGKRRPLELDPSSG